MGQDARSRYRPTVDDIPAKGFEAAHLRFGVDLGERAWFVGDAAERMAPLLEGPGRRCVGRPATAAAMVSLARAQFAAGATADLAYATPNYGKQYTPGTARNPFAP